MRSSRFVGAVFGAAVTLASGAPTGAAAGAESGDEDGRRSSSPVLVVEPGYLLCFSTDLDLCLEDPRAGRLRLLAARLDERKAWAETPLREWIPGGEPILDGRECLIPGGIGCSDRVTARGLDGILDISSQVVRLEVARVAPAATFPEAEEADPDLPSFVRIDTLIEATVVSMDLLRPDAVYLEPGTEVWLFFDEHEPVTLRDQPLCSHGLVPSTLASLSAGDTPYLFPPGHGFTSHLAPHRPSTSVAHWDDVTVFGADELVRQLPFSVDGADEANPLRLDDFDWLLSRAVARAQTR